MFKSKWQTKNICKKCKSIINRGLSACPKCGTYSIEYLDGPMVEGTSTGGMLLIFKEIRARKIWAPTLLNPFKTDWEIFPDDKADVDEIMSQ